jgi:hypothetical protein
MKVIGWAAIAVALGVGFGCGGGNKKTADSRASRDNADSQPEPGQGAILVPEEKYDEIKRLFERKTTIIGRCFVEALDAGEIAKGDKILVTVSTTITEAGAPTNTRVLKASTGSKTMKQCIVKYVSSWDFPTLPKPVEFSHVYRFEEF